MQNGTFGLVSVKDENYSSLLLSDKPLEAIPAGNGIQCVPWHTSVLEGLVAQAQNQNSWFPGSARIMAHEEKGKGLNLGVCRREGSGSGKIIIQPRRSMFLI